jgi:hypothetical protein
VLLVEEDIGIESNTQQKKKNTRLKTRKHANRPAHKLKYACMQTLYSQHRQRRGGGGA